MNEPQPSVRIFPDNWLESIPLHRYFSCQQPLDIDVGCGKGRFLLAHAAANPQTNILGIDRMLQRIRKIDHKVIRARLDNIRLLRMEASYAVTYLIPPDSVSTYYIFFPDPWPKKKHHRHRLFSPVFLQALHTTLLVDGIIHVATDDLAYAEEIRELFQADNRFSPCPVFEPEPDKRTDFELYYVDQGDIGRCSFKRVSTEVGRTVHLNHK